MPKRNELDAGAYGHPQLSLLIKGGKEMIKEMIIL